MIPLFHALSSSSSVCHILQDFYKSIRNLDPRSLIGHDVGTGP